MKSIKPIIAIPKGEVVPIKMVQYGTAVALELKLGKLERENAELRKLVEQMKEWLEGGCSGCCEKNTDECRNECRVNRLLEAAKGLEK